MFQGFQRLKAGIDSRIAEEQARQRSHGSSPARSNSALRPGNSSPVRKAKKPRSRDDDANGKSADPSDFEAAFVIEDEAETPSRVGTPVIADEKAVAMPDSGTPSEGSTPVDGSEKSTDANERPSIDLPAEVRSKLRRAAKIEATYQELLSSYKIAHRRASLIEPFEKALKENTPLTTIKDPDALIEYLNQLNLKGDMVMDELKRVTGDRDLYKKRSDEAEQRVAALEKGQNGYGTHGVEVLGDKMDASSVDTPSTSVKSPVSSIRRIFSPATKSEPFPKAEASEEFFSYDEEVPKLQADLSAKTEEVQALQDRIATLESDLDSAQESSSKLVANLEKATRELNDIKEASSTAEVEKEEARKDIQDWTDKLRTSQDQLSTMRIELKEQKLAIENKSTELEKQKNEYEATLNISKDVLLKNEESHKTEMRGLANGRDAAERARENAEKEFRDFREMIAADTKRMQELWKEGEGARDVETATKTDAIATEPTTDSAAPSQANKKKTNKKKKKGGVPIAKDTAESKEPAGSALTTTGDLQAMIIQLKLDLADRDTQISKLQSQGKTVADLREELENMQDNFLQVGQSHVEAKEAIKALKSERTELQARLITMEQALEESKSQSKVSSKADFDFTSLTQEYESLKDKTTNLQTDLSATQQLASTRYKDLMDLKDVLSKAQPELKTLRADAASLKATKEELATRSSELRRLEVREQDLKSDIASFKKQAKDRDEQVRGFEEKMEKVTGLRTKAEDQLRFAQRDGRKAEADKVHLAASNEKLSAELSQINEEAGRMRTKVRNLESQIGNLSAADQGLRDEVKLRGEQYDNAQALINSMRDQSHEMAMQLKESKEQCESLEEELGEVQRLLGERTREAETMRRLLADVDGRADAKVRDIKDRMEKAIEDRERIEDESSRESRRRAREVDDLKSTIRTVEKDLREASDEREELSEKIKEWKKRREEGEVKDQTTRKEGEELRIAMEDMRSRLEGSVKQAREADRARNELRRVVDEGNERYESVKKELRQLQTVRRSDGSRGSGDFGTSGGSGGGGPQGGIGQQTDYVYLKTILLQFLEVKDKKVRTSLVQTVLGRLLLFDKKDQERWVAAIASM